MNIIKIFIIFLFLIIPLTGCFPKEKPQSNVLPPSPVVKSKSNSVKTVTIKPLKPILTIHKVAKPIETSHKEKPANSSKDEQVNSSKVNIVESNGFVLLSSLDKDIVINLKYATTDNFTKKVVYPNSVCVLRKTTADKLVKANTQLKKLGYIIKVWDAYRPVYVQQIFWDIVKDSRFVANPKNGGSIHNKGCAVDITLVDVNGAEVKMPSKFDDFSSNAYRNNSKMTVEAKKNMDLLTKCMVANGFTTINTEWWHFEDMGSKNYKIANINLNQFLK